MQHGVAIDSCYVFLFQKYMEYFLHFCMKYSLFIEKVVLKCGISYPILSISYDFESCDEKIRTGLDFVLGSPTFAWMTP